MKRTLIAIVVALFVALPVSGAWAVFVPNQTVQGTVKAVTSDSITILRNDASGKQARMNQAQSVEIDLSAQTNTPNVKSWKDIPEGSHVEVEYKKDGQERVATTIRILENKERMNQKPIEG